MKTKLILTAALMLATTGTAQAQIFENWAGEASLTGSQTTGNTDTTDIGFGLKLKKDDGQWRHKFKGLADFGRADGQTNKQRFSVGYQIDRDFTDRLYGFANGDYYNDDFGAFEEGYFIGGGIGYKTILPEPISWNLEGGAGYRSQTEQGLDITQNEFALRGFSDFDWVINENVSAYNDTEIIWSDSDTYIWNEVGITATLAGNLAARASFRVDTHSDVPAGTEKTDTITRFGIVYTLK